MGRCGCDDMDMGMPEVSDSGTGGRVQPAEGPTDPWDELLLIFADEKMFYQLRELGELLKDLANQADIAAKAAKAMDGVVRKGWWKGHE